MAGRARSRFTRAWIRKVSWSAEDEFRMRRWKNDWSQQNRDQLVDLNAVEKHQVVNRAWLQMRVTQRAEEKGAAKYWSG